MIPDTLITKVESMIPPPPVGGCRLYGNQSFMDSLSDETLYVLQYRLMGTRRQRWMAKRFLRKNGVRVVWGPKPVASPPLPTVDY